MKQVLVNYLGIRNYLDRDKEQNIMIEQLTINELYDLKETIAKDIFEGVDYPFEVLPKISAFIVELGNKLPTDKFEKRGEMSGLLNPQR